MKNTLQLLAIVVASAFLGYTGYHAALKRNSTWRLTTNASKSLKVVTIEGTKSICPVAASTEVCRTQRERNEVVARAGVPVKHLGITATGKFTQNRVLFVLCFVIIIIGYLIIIPLVILAWKLASKILHREPKARHG